VVLSCLTASNDAVRSYTLSPIVFADLVQLTMHIK